MTTMEGLEERLSILERRVDDMAHEVFEGQLDTWKARIEELEVQASLGRMEVRDQVQPMVTQLQNRWLDARAKLDETGHSAGDAIEAIRASLHDAFIDLRDGADEARRTLLRQSQS